MEEPASDSRLLSSFQPRSQRALFQGRLHTVGWLLSMLFWGHLWCGTQDWNSGTSRLKVGRGPDPGRVTFPSSPLLPPSGIPSSLPQRQRLSGFPTPPPHLTGASWEPLKSSQPPGPEWVKLQMASGPGASAWPRVS